MEKCKYCKAELAEDSTVCPNCGRNNTEEEISAEAAAPVEENAAEEAAAAEAAAEETVTPEATEETPAQADAPEEPSAEIKEGKKATPGKIALAVAAVVVLLAALIALVMVGLKDEPAEDGTAAAETNAAAEETVAATVPADGNPEDVTCKGSYTVSDEEVLANKDTVVATMGEHELTNGQLQVYYWSMVNSYLSSDYGYYVMMYGGIDYTKPLDTQLYLEDNSLTWQQYFLQEALDYWQMSQSMAVEAEKAGMEMSQEDREYLDNLESSMQANADSYGITLEELIAGNVGAGAGLEEFKAFQELYCEGKDFYAAELEKMTPSEADLEAFFAEHEEDYAANGVTKDSKYVDVRHILIQVESTGSDEEGNAVATDEDWASCEAEAQDVLDTWLAGDKTEDSFAALANEKSEDPGSNTNGGLYENVYEGQMVPEFNDWCFDASRKYGDYGLVKTSYGYHIMFYVSNEPVWTYYAENDWISEQSNKFIEDLAAANPIEVAYDKINLGFIDLG